MAGTIKDGYVVISIDGKSYKAHRLALFYETEECPIGDVDHINGVRDDNRLSNLRECSRSENSQNVKRARVNNKSGFLGVSLHKKSGKWESHIKINGASKHLGLFASPEMAHNAYIEAKRDMHPFNTI